METMKIKTPAKINLYLRVADKRDDGFHNIQTVFLPLPDLTDEIILDESGKEGVEIRSESKQIPLGPDNLCWRAAASFATAAGVTPAWRLTIVKEIPVAAGLGGGSSDAAAVLRLLNRRYNDILSPAELYHIATALGSDVPFFLNPFPALATGRGECLEYFTCNSQIPLLIINPGVPIPTGWAYQHCNPAATVTTGGDLKTALINGESVATLAGMVHNDLEPAVERKYLIIPVIKDFLRQQKGCCATCMSGSGSTVFGMFATASDASDAQLEAENYFGLNYYITSSEMLNQ